MNHQPTIAQTPLPLGVSNVIAFFHLPNPKIFQLFLISSVATFSLGTAMIIEWFYHGQHHPGYHWIIYFAPSMVVFPLLMFIICLISANLFRTKDQAKLTLPVVIDRSESSQSSTQQTLHREIRDREVQVEPVEALIDEEAMVQVEAVCDHTSDLINVDQARTGNGGDLTLRRSLSLSFSRAFPENCSNLKRSSSIR
ncbi:hypothetical protein ACSBR2_003726 [Camellia fascicularis]